MREAIIRRALSSAAASIALWAFCARPVLAAETPLPPPVSDEAHGLTGADRQTALLVLGAHYQNMLDAYGPLQLSGLDWLDPAKPARCEVRLSLSTTGYREGSFIEGLPVRRAQPLVFKEVQQQLMAGVVRCGNSMAFTTRTWAELEQSALALVLRNSGTTFCLKDEDCYGVELADPCGARPALRAFGSATTDSVFFVAYRKFLWSFMNNSAHIVNNAMGRLGGEHPDHGLPFGSDRCPMKHWEERPIEAICVRHSCRAKAPGP